MDGPFGDDPDRLLRDADAKRQAEAQRDADAQRRAEAERNRRLAPNAETDDPGNSDRFHLRMAPGLREGYPTKQRTGPDAESRRGTPGPHNDDAALNSQGGPDPTCPRRAPGGPPAQDAAGNPLPGGTAPLVEAKRRTVEDDVAAARPPAGGPTIWGNAPRGASPVGSGSGTNLSGTVAAGTAGHMGQVGPGTSVQAAMGATDEQGEGFGTASGTWTREDPAKQRRADDVPIADPRPEGQRPKSDA
jgi:hypothetical protein